MRRRFQLALLASLLLHLLLMAAPGWHLGDLLPDDVEPIEARLVARAAPKAEPPPVTRKPRPAKPRPAPPAEPAPVIEEVVPESETPAVEEEAPPAEPMPEPEAAVDAGAAPGLAPAPEVVPDIAPTLPRKGRIAYSVARGRSGFTIGRSVHEWEHDGRRYRMTAVAETTGIAALFKSVKAVQTSEGGFLRGELKPENFHFDRGNGEINTARFDWQAQQVTLGDGQVVPIAEGAEDFLSMFYQLALAAQRGEGFVMAVATGKKVERYAFEWLGEETVLLPLGEVATWHVRVRSAAGGKDVTDVWLARDMAGLPVKIRNTDRKGEVYEQNAEAVEYESK